MVKDEKISSFIRGSSKADGYKINYEKNFIFRKNGLCFDVRASVKNITLTITTYS